MWDKLTRPRGVSLFHASPWLVVWISMVKIGGSSYTELNTKIYCFFECFWSFFNLFWGSFKCHTVFFWGGNATKLMYINKSMVSFSKDFCTCIVHCLGWWSYNDDPLDSWIPLGCGQPLVNGLYLKNGGEKSSIPEAESSCCRHDGVVSHMVAMDFLPLALGRQWMADLQHDR